MKDTEDTVLGGNIKDAPKKFRIAAQTFAITYPRCGIEPKKVMDFIKSIRLIDHIAVCQEHHKDEGLHLHVYVRFNKKYNCKNCHAFDIEEFHPNIQACKSPQKWYEYIHKDEGVQVESFEFDFLNPANFQKRKADFDCWRMYIYKRKLDKEPLKAIDIGGVNFELKGKKRHILLVTDPDWGKTTMIENMFEGKAVYKISGSKYPFDNYDGEPTIIFDDCMPPLQMLLSCSNTYKTLTPVYGDTRYGVKYWPMYEDRLMIILLNDLPNYHDIPAFVARFNIIDLRKDKQEINQYDDWGF